MTMYTFLPYGDQILQSLLSLCKRMQRPIAALFDLRKNIGKSMFYNCLFNLLRYVY